MSIGTDFIPEFEQEMTATRRTLEAIPDRLLSWQAHPDLRTIGWVANHLAELPGWVAGTLGADEWDIHPVGGEPYQSPSFDRTQDILALFDRNIASAKAALMQASDEVMQADWSLKAAGRILFTMTRAGVVRRWVLNHTVHHRGHLCVYLRLNDLSIPALYGPSGDE